jgi:hypothetical protein
MNSFHVRAAGCRVRTVLTCADHLATSIAVRVAIVAEWGRSIETMEKDQWQAYVIFDVLPGGDMEAMKPYREKAFDTLVPYGGKTIVRTSEIDVREVRRDTSWLDADAPSHHRISHDRRGAGMVRL